MIPNAPMPMQRPPGGPGMPAGAPPGGSPMPPGQGPASEGNDIPPEQAKQLISQAVQQLKQIADKYGIDLVAMINQAGRPSAPPPPPSGGTPPPRGI